MAAAQLLLSALRIGSWLPPALNKAQNALRVSLQPLLVYCSAARTADISASLACLRPWLDYLPDPVALRVDVLSVRALLEGVRALEGSNTMLAELPSSLTRLRDNSTSVLGTAVPRIARTLQALQAAYAGAAPCMLRLLRRVAHVNDTVLVLPTGLQDKVAMLQRVEASAGMGSAGYAVRATPERNHARAGMSD